MTHHVRLMVLGFVVGVGVFACSAEEETPPPAESDKKAIETEPAQAGSPSTSPTEQGTGGKAQARNDGGAPHTNPNGPLPNGAPPPIVACSGKAEGAECTVTVDGGTHTGTCQKLPIDVLGCRPSGAPKP